MLAGRFAFNLRSHPPPKKNIDLPLLNLQKFDRLEPNPLLLNVNDFDAIDVFPATVLFWRTESETIARHRNPLFSIPGVWHGLLLIDILHCVFLGVGQNWVVASMWRVLLLNVWQIPAFDAKTRHTMGLSRLRSELK